MQETQILVFSRVTTSVFLRKCPSHVKVETTSLSTRQSDLNKDTKYFRPTQFVKPAFVYAENHDSVNKRL